MLLIREELLELRDTLSSVVDLVVVTERRPIPLNFLRI